MPPPRQAVWRPLINVPGGLGDTLREVDSQWTVMTTNTQVGSWWRTYRWQLYAPVYDWAARPFEGGRKQAIDRLDLDPDDRILIVGCGTGGDLPYLPAGAAVTAIDLVPSMVIRTTRRAESLGRSVETHVGDAQSLPFEDDSFDAVLLHLVLTVVPDPDAVVAETARVLDSGRVSVLDKFVPKGADPSLARRLVDPVASTLFSSVTRDLESIFAGEPLTVERTDSLLAGLYTVAVARPGRET